MSSTHGAFTISIDLELMWGVWDNAPRASDAMVAARERAICARLVRLFERYALRVTWAVVGRLLDREPGFDGLRGPSAAWYAPDIIEPIERSTTRHDIGSHGYAHLYFGTFPRSALKLDLDRASAVHARHGHAMCSFVFPRNQIAHLDLLAECGVRVFRSTDQGILSAIDALAPRARPLVNLLEKALAMPVQTVRPLRREFGLVEVPSSMLLLGRDGLRGLVSPKAMRHKLLTGLAQAARKKEVFHLWFHPSNFYVDEDLQFELLEGAIVEACRLERQGDIQVRTMSDFAEDEVAR